MKLKVTIQDIETGKVLYETEFPTKAHFFEVCINYGERSLKSAKRLTEIGWDMYMKDYNDTPLGKLADFLAKEVKNIKKFEQLSRWEQLDAFYNWKGLV
jgi:hypothetical protein